MYIMTMAEISKVSGNLIVKGGKPDMNTPRLTKIREGMKSAPKPSKPARLDLLAKERKLPPFLCRSS